MTLEQIDKNFKLSTVTEKDVVWHDVREVPFRIYGVYYEESEGRFRRLPAAVAEATSASVAHLATHTAGGRVRFVTDSPYIAIRAASSAGTRFSHMPLSGVHGFALTEDRFHFVHAFMPEYTAVTDAPFAFESITYPWHKSFHTEGKHLYSISFPLYGRTDALFIGLKEGCLLEAAPDYTYEEKPVLFYGSSITQGGCASRSDTDYVSRLSRMLDTDILNLGFSGSARAEDAMIAYLASLDPSVFVLDYDHNAPSLEHLEATHEKLFLAFRAAHPDTPVIMMSRPDFHNGLLNVERRAIIKKTYDNAKARGDGRVWFIDGETLFAGEDRESCTVEDCHPTDLGFFRMAKTVEPLLREALAIAYGEK